MRTYAVYSGGGTDFVLIRDTFSWGAVLFAPLWALWHRMWLVAGLFVVINVALSFIAYGQDLGVLSMGFGLLVGFVASDIRCWHLEQKGWTLDAIVTGADRDAAERRFLDARPELTSALLP
jgi:hypothetical protein